MYTRVKDIIKAYDEGGIENVKAYFKQDELEIDPNTWASSIKKCLDDELEITAGTELELMSEKFKLYKNVSKEE